MSSTLLKSSGGTRCSPSSLISEVKTFLEVFLIECHTIYLFVFQNVQFVEIHGDRHSYDGIGTIDGRRFMFIGHQKSRNTKENIQRNFGMPTPHGYRKALRMMYYADHLGFPIVTFIDTPGAFAELKSE